MNKSFSKLAYVGTDHLKDPLDFQRVFFVNVLSILGVSISFIDGILLYLEGLYLQFGVTIVSLLLYSLVLLLNKKRYYITSSYLFLIFSLCVVIAVTIVAYRQGRFNETENILIALMTVAYLLLQGRAKLVGFWFGFAVLIGCKIFKQQYLSGSYDFTFWLTLQNITILCIILFFTIDAFRKSLIRSVNKLKEKDEVLYSMVDNIPVFIALIDSEQKYKMVNLNYEKAFGKTREEIIGSSVKEVLPENILKAHLPMVEDALKGESPEFLELTQMPDGSSFYAGGKYLPIHSEDGKVVGATVFAHDVSKLEVAKIELKEASETKDRLLSIVAHDIRGPLDSFEGLLNVSSEYDLSPQQFKEHQKNVREKLVALKETVNTLLEWARSQLDGINTRPVEVDVHQIVDNNRKLYKELISRKKIHLDIDVPKNTHAWIDENHFKICVRNLMHNALKFTPKEGEVAVSVTTEKDKIAMTIKDSGIGMNEERIHSIMNKELQDSKSGTSGELGTGIGMSLSLGLLEKNNCTFRIASKPNHGTEIKLSIPTGRN